MMGNIDKKDKDFTPGLPYNENPMYKIAVYYKNVSTTIWNSPDKQIGTDLSYFFAPNIQKIITDFFRSSTSDIKPKPYLVVQLWKTQTSESGERQLTTWEEDLDLKTTTPIGDVQEILERIIAGTLDSTIIENTIYLELSKEIYDGWKFSNFHRDGDDMSIKFKGINDKLSSYYWDKYNIKLEFNWMINYFELSCTFNPDNKKPINKTFTQSLPRFDIKDLNSDVMNIKLNIQNNLKSFFEQTKNK